MIFHGILKHSKCLFSNNKNCNQQLHTRGSETKMYWLKHMQTEHKFMLPMSMTHSSGRKCQFCNLFFPTVTSLIEHQRTELHVQHNPNAKKLGPSDRNKRLRKEYNKCKKIQRKDTCWNEDGTVCYRGDFISMHLFRHDHAQQYGANIYKKYSEEEPSLDKEDYLTDELVQKKKKNKKNKKKKMIMKNKSKKKKIKNKKMKNKSKKKKNKNK